ncbi:hypothetical protein BMJ32_15990 [Sinorhizobium medicae]|nr:hypothetical protein BMJ32_15990 [Sinorhizobium medicae]PLU01490.1 hypothetical protein BMJ33_19045 [Sinorhizobium medicae]PLU02412.1 hypothetical protein BMJ34_10545 [Sinorhizobium medicae]PLU11830.1 hypothetical protein BMJ30_28825 [Sinorhizobium medicae]PLU16345.1 hypothetical protein BMJ31_23560 [Sinorhizobium medicae]
MAATELRIAKMADRPEPSRQFQFPEPQLVRSVATRRTRGAHLLVESAHAGKTFCSAPARRLRHQEAVVSEKAEDSGCSQTVPSVSRRGTGCNPPYRPSL